MTCEERLDHALSAVELAQQGWLTAIAREEELTTSLQHVLAAAEFRRPRFDESGDEWLKARDDEWMNSVKAARSVLANPGGKP